MGSLDGGQGDGDRELLRGGDLMKAILVATALGAAYVAWKYVKHGWMVEHGYLPEWMRGYWVVYAVLVVGAILWGALTRFKA